MGPTGPDVVDVGPTGPDVSDVGPTGPDVSGPTSDPNVITINEILNNLEVLRQKEADVARLIEQNMTGLSIAELKIRLLQWASSRFPPMYPIASVEVMPLSVCSDGIHRPMQQFIEFCTGTTVEAIVNRFKEKMPDLIVSFLFLGNTFNIYVTTP